MLKEAVQTSYRRGGEETSLTTEVKKQTVKNKIHALEFPKNNEKPVKKKVVEYLYIEADEDHASLQFREKKGDLIENENHRKNNCLITKLVYVHEGIEKEAPKSKRQKLINPHYFCGTSYEENNTEFWDEIYEYISNHYDLDKVKKIYLSSDGGAWIKSGMKRIAGITYVLDEFHLEKYLTKLTSHMKDSREDALDELRTAIRSKTKQDFEEIVDRIESCLEDEAGLKRIAIAKEYILSNWMAAKLRLRHRNGVKGSSTEGHMENEKLEYITVDFVRRIPVDIFEKWYADQDIYRKVTYIPTAEELEKDYICLQDAADLLGISREKLAKIARREEIGRLLDSTICNNKRWITRKSFQLFLNAQNVYHIMNDGDKQEESQLLQENEKLSLETKEYISRQEAAELAGVSVSTVTKWMQTGEFQCVGAGKVLRVHR